MLSAVVHTCLDIAAAEAELPALCAGDVSVAATSGLGSNVAKASAERVVPKVVFFGGDISDSDVEKLSGLIREKAPAMLFVKVSKLDVLKAGGLGPNPDVIAKVYRKKMSKEIEVGA